MTSLMHRLAATILTAAREAFDSVWYGELDGVTVDLSIGMADEGGGVEDVLVDIEGINGSHGDDTLIGNWDDNIIDGLAGDDFIDGNEGYDNADYYGDPDGVYVNLEEEHRHRWLWWTLTL